MFKRFLIILFIIKIVSANIAVIAQQAIVKNAAEIYLNLKKLNVLGSILFIAAHPDDENTAVLAYLANEKLVRTGYLSITRGDGGQNLIGSEKGEALGLIRTQELLAARKIDGAEQYFTRAIDFGYSKSSEESINIWNHERILADLVWIIRKYRPDVLVTRFTSELGGHGHHRASALLAEEAFYAAGEVKRFPDQLKQVEPWTPKRLVWNSWRMSSSPGQNIPSINTGTFNHLLGKSYGEIAALSRSKHWSQGFGSSARRGDNLEYFQHLAGDVAENDLFDHIDIKWSRIENSSLVQKYVDEAIKKYHLENPSAILPELLSAYAEMNKLPETHWKKIKQQEISDLIRDCAGLWLTAESADYTVIPGENLSLRLNAINRSDLPLELTSLVLPFQNDKTIIKQLLKYNTIFELEKKVIIPERTTSSQPYWLINHSLKGSYDVENLELIGFAENPKPPSVKFIFSMGGIEIGYEVPIYYRWTDPVGGEKYRSLEILPPVIISIRESVLIFPDENSKEITVGITANKSINSGSLSLQLPASWSVQPTSIPFSFSSVGEEKMVKFSITPPAFPSQGTLLAKARIGTNSFQQSLERIQYPHIPIQTYLKPASAELVHLNLKKEGNLIGYIMGSGDEIPDYLRHIGYQVNLLEDADLDTSDLNKYDAIIAGIRAYNTRSRLEQTHSRLLNYVKNGGTFIVQYNTNRSLIVNPIGPYPLEISRARVSVEDAPVEILQPNHQILNFPNKIDVKDFEGWVQERGLYFAGRWDPKYEAVISSNDPGENPQNGGLIFSKYDKGIFIYTGLSWFRQLPAGVPGAYKLFVNLISAGNFNEK